jgi:hypothetical protein
MFVSLSHYFSTYFKGTVKPLASFWHEFKHSIVVGIRLHHSWQLMTSHFHFHITVESVAPAVWWKASSLHWNNWYVHCVLSTALSECYHYGMFKLVHCRAQGLHCKVMRLPWNTELHAIFMNYLLNILHAQWLNWSTVCLRKVCILMTLHFCKICSVPFEEIQLFC